jgi:hypothetical protein
MDCVDDSAALFSSSQRNSIPPMIHHTRPHKKPTVNLAGRAAKLSPGRRISVTDTTEQISGDQPPRLLAPNETPALGTIRIPEEFYQVLDSPAPLAGAMFPSENFPWDEAHARGYQWVACLCSENPPYTPSKLKFACVVELHDFSVEEEAPNPKEELGLIREAALKVRALLMNRQGVLVHCAGGRGRTGTVIGAVLCLLGHKPAAVIRYLDSLHKRRGCKGWPEARWQAQVLQQFTSRQPQKRRNTHER